MFYCSYIIWLKKIIIKKKNNARSHFVSSIIIGIRKLKRGNTNPHWLIGKKGVITQNSTQTEIQKYKSSNTFKNQKVLSQFKVIKLIIWVLNGGPLVLPARPLEDYDKKVGILQ